MNRRQRIAAVRRALPGVDVSSDGQPIQGITADVGRFLLFGQCIYDCAVRSSGCAIISGYELIRSTGNIREVGGPYKTDKAAIAAFAKMVKARSPQ